MTPFFSSMVAPIKYEINGVHYMKIYGIIYELPSPDSKMYKKYLKCNNFCAFRVSCIEALKTITSDCIEVSRYAAACWSIASQEFKDFFTKYSQTIKELQKSKVFKIKQYKHNPERVPRKRGPNKKKVPESIRLNKNELSVEQEIGMCKNYQEELEHFASIEPVPYSPSPYSYYMY
ncbi:hypothetical protein C1645_823603 [Glomus cerebriforme]|uniref:Uncharacterized protein n=1 Tax=Glomus cerebriforme TaxID=658196 RepID=A0A397T5G7_9GLOM|nr:hypothetical protein C1645_823603 [Glomus cerebriforme]